MKQISRFGIILLLMHINLVIIEMIVHFKAHKDCYAVYSFNIWNKAKFVIFGLFSVLRRTKRVKYSFLTNISFITFNTGYPKKSPLRKCHCFKNIYTSLHPMMFSESQDTQNIPSRKLGSSISYFFQYWLPNFCHLKSEIDFYWFS